MSGGLERNDSGALGAEARALIEAARGGHEPNEISRARGIPSGTDAQFVP